MVTGPRVAKEHDHECIRFEVAEGSGSVNASAFVGILQPDDSHHQRRKKETAHYPETVEGDVGACETIELENGLQVNCKRLEEIKDAFDARRELQVEHRADLGHHLQHITKGSRYIPRGNRL